MIVKKIFHYIKCDYCEQEFRQARTFIQYGNAHFCSATCLGEYVKKSCETFWANDYLDSIGLSEVETQNVEEFYD